MQPVKYEIFPLSPLSRHRLSEFSTKNKIKLIFVNSDEFLYEIMKIQA